MVILKTLGKFESLKGLSKALQFRDLRLSQIVNLIKRQLKVFSTMSRNLDITLKSVILLSDSRHTILDLIKLCNLCVCILYLIQIHKRVLTERFYCHQL